MERRDRLREAERRRWFNRSPWEIGSLCYDQRDLYTRNASVTEEGYGVGPSLHPREGSYAYTRGSERRPVADGDGTLAAREAWPWLHYEAPAFAPLEHEESSFWRRLSDRVRRSLQASRSPRTPEDVLLARDVRCALTYRGDLDVTEIDVSARGGEVTLEGSVPDRHSKRIAEETSKRVHDVRAVCNRLAIRPVDPRGGGGVTLCPLSFT